MAGIRLQKNVTTVVVARGVHQFNVGLTRSQIQSLVTQEVSGAVKQPYRTGQTGPNINDLAQALKDLINSFSLYDQMSVEGTSLFFRNAEAQQFEVSLLEVLRDGVEAFARPATTESNKRSSLATNIGGYLRSLSQSSGQIHVEQVASDGNESTVSFTLTSTGSPSQSHTDQAIVNLAGNLLSTLPEFTYTPGPPNVLTFTAPAIPANTVTKEMLVATLRNHITFLENRISRVNIGSFTWRQGLGDAGNQTTLRVPPNVPGEVIYATLSGDDSGSFSFLVSDLYAKATWGNAQLDDSNSLVFDAAGPGGERLRIGRSGSGRFVPAFSGPGDYTLALTHDKSTIKPGAIDGSGVLWTQADLFQNQQLPVGPAADGKLAQFSHADDRWNAIDLPEGKTNDEVNALIDGRVPAWARMARRFTELEDEVLHSLFKLSSAALWAPSTDIQVSGYLSSVTADPSSLTWSRNFTDSTAVAKTNVYVGIRVPLEKRGLVADGLLRLWTGNPTEPDDDFVQTRSPVWTAWTSTDDTHAYWWNLYSDIGGGFTTRVDEHQQVNIDFPAIANLWQMAAWARLGNGDLIPDSKLGDWDGTATELAALSADERAQYKTFYVRN